MMWLVQYKASSGQEMTTKHDSRESAFNQLADTLFASALLLWESPAPQFQEQGDRLMRHAVRLTAEAEMGDDNSDGYLLRLSQGRRWVVCSV